jgi:hypothetical protein
VSKIKYFGFSAVGSFIMTANVLQLGEVAELEAQMFSLVQMFIRIPNLQIGTGPPILPNCC